MQAIQLERIRDAFGENYSIDRELGKGGMATVYLAQDVKHDRIVALKVLHPDLAATLGPERFLREIKLAARLNHPHILPLFDSGETGSFLYYVMPYVEGESLRERLDRDQQLPIDEAVHHGRAIASALDYAHRQGIVHRDIKPENVMLYEGEAMVMDFGIAKAVSAAGSETLTQTGMMVGTPAYVSPEQAAGEANLDGKSDQYSLACVVYEMITGERPFTGATPQAIMSKRFTEMPKPLRSLRSTVSESVEKAVTRAMSTDASGRYSTTAQFGQALASGKLETPTNTQTVPVAAVSAAKSVAVLPFANLSADAENEYFTEGMADEILNALSKIQSLRVASRTSSFAFKGKNEDIRRIAKTLGVTLVLEGSVRRAGGRLRVTAQLVDAADGAHRWSQRYDREMSDIFAVQDDIAAAIAGALKLQLAPASERRMPSLPAYEAYLRYRSYQWQFTPEASRRSRECLEQALALDPEFALPYVGLADYHFALAAVGASPSHEAMPRARELAQRALEIDPDLPEAHAMLGIVAGHYDYDWIEAERRFRLAVTREPLSPHLRQWYGTFFLFAIGRADEACLQLSRVIAEDPLCQMWRLMRANLLPSVGLEHEALDDARKAVELDPDFWLGWADLRAALRASAPAYRSDAVR